MNLSYVEIKELPLVNKKQILFDWINTINEPRCLLVSQSKDLLNGDVFVEMLSHFLHLTNNKEMGDKLQKKGVDLETPEIKVKIVLDFFYEICHTHFEYNKRIKSLLTMIKNIFDKEEVLIEMVELVREIYDTFHITNMLDVDIEITNTNMNDTRNQHQQQQRNFPNTIQCYKRDLKSSDQSYNDTVNDELRAKRCLTIPNNSISHSHCNNRNNRFPAYPNTHTNNTNKSHSVRHLSHQNTNFINIIDYSTIPSLPHSSTTIAHSITRANPSLSHNKPTIPSTKFLKSTTNMTRGILQVNKALFNLDYPLPRLKYLKFHKPSEPAITCNSKAMSKYKPISTYTPIHIHSANKPEQPTSHNELIINTTLDSDNAHKKRVHKWLLYLNLIKSEIISIEQIPLLCANGVLLSDVINKCEGRFPIIKGIARHPLNQTQIKANINKVLGYLESNEKFSSKYLWSANEIIAGEVGVIWGLLYDIYVYYHTKDKMSFVNRLSKSKEKYKQSRKDKRNEECKTLNRSGNGLYRNGNVNTNYINHITNSNGENDMLMNFICKKKNEQKANKLMNIDCSEIKTNWNNSNFVSRRERTLTNNTNTKFNNKRKRNNVNTLKGYMNRQRLLKGNK